MHLSYAKCASVRDDLKEDAPGLLGGHGRKLHHVDDLPRGPDGILCLGTKTIKGI